MIGSGLTSIPIAWLARAVALALDAKERLRECVEARGVDGVAARFAEPERVLSYPLKGRRDQPEPCLTPPVHLPGQLLRMERVAAAANPSIDRGRLRLARGVDLCAEVSLQFQQCGLVLS